MRWENGWVVHNQGEKGDNEQREVNNEKRERRVADNKERER